MPAVELALDAFRDYVLPSDDLSVLCGAGVSMVPPTALPSGDELRDECVRLLLTDRTSNKFLRRMMASDSYRRLLPERVLQDIGSFASKSVDGLMAGLLAGAVPNAVHGHLARNYRHLFTTNFDLCLETCGAKLVSHLHGSISEPESLQNRIFRLGQTARGEFAKFRARIAGRRLLILGYSMRDQDIIEAVESARPSEIFYLSYDGGLPAYLRYTALSVRHARGGADDLFGIAVTDKRPRRRGPLHARPRWLRPAVERRASALLHLLYSSGFYEDVSPALRAYLPRLRGRGKYKAINSVVDALRVSGRYDEAVFWCDYIASSEFVNRPENAEILSTAFVVRGLIDLDRGRKNYAEIEHRFLEALRLTKLFESLQEDDSQKAAIQIWKARIYNNLGLVAAAGRRRSKAITYFNRSLLIKERYHEETGIAQTYSNLAKLFLEDGDYHMAAESLRLVVRLMEKSPSRYVCGDAVAEALRAIAEKVPLPPRLIDPALPITAGSDFWSKLSGFLRRRAPEALAVINELKSLNALLLKISPA